MRKSLIAYLSAGLIGFSCPGQAISEEGYKCLASEGMGYVIQDVMETGTYDELETSTGEKVSIYMKYMTQEGIEIIVHRSRNECLLFTVFEGCQGKDISADKDIIRAVVEIEPFDCKPEGVGKIAVDIKEGPDGPYVNDVSVFPMDPDTEECSKQTMRKYPGVMDRLSERIKKDRENKKERYKEYKWAGPALASANQ